MSGVSDRRQGMKTGIGCHHSDRDKLVLSIWQSTALFAAISRGEFTINGFRNRDLRALLFTTTSGPMS